MSLQEKLGLVQLARDMGRASRGGRTARGRGGFHAKSGGKVRTAVHRPPTALGGGIVVKGAKVLYANKDKVRKAMHILAMANAVRKAVVTAGKEKKRK